MSEAAASILRDIYGANAGKKIARRFGVSTDTAKLWLAGRFPSEGPDTNPDRSCAAATARRQLSKRREEAMSQADDTEPSTEALKAARALFVGKRIGAGDGHTHVVRATDIKTVALALDRFATARVEAAAIAMQNENDVLHCYEIGTPNVSGMATSRMTYRRSRRC